MRQAVGGGVGGGVGTCRCGHLGRCRCNKGAGTIDLNQAGAVHVVCTNGFRGAGVDAGVGVTA